jgi:hypothetical protein
LFQNLLSNDEFETAGTPTVDLGPVNAAYASLEAFEHLCERESEKAFHACLLEIVRNLYLSTHDGVRSPFWMLKYDADICSISIYGLDEGKHPFLLPNEPCRLPNSHQCFQSRWPASLVALDSCSDFDESSWPG